MFSGTYLFRPNKRVPSGKPPRHLNFLRASLILILCFEQGSDIIFLDPLLDVAHVSHYFHRFWNKQLTAKGTSERLFCLIEVQFLTLHLIYIYFFLCSVRMKNLVLWQPPGLTKFSWCWLAILLLNYTNWTLFWVNYIQKYCIAFEILVKQVIYLQKLYLHL